MGLDAGSVPAIAPFLLSIFTKYSKYHISAHTRVRHARARKFLYSHIKKIQKRRLRLQRRLR